MCTSYYSGTLAVTLAVAETLDPSESFYAVLGDVLLGRVPLAAIMLNQPISGETNRTDVNLTQRANAFDGEWYEFFGFRHDDCASSDLLLTYSDECVTVANPFSSYRACNPNSVSMMFVTWPHHSCQKNNYRRHAITADTIISCNPKTTYSWYGVMKDDICYLDPTESECVGVYTWTWSPSSTYNTIYVGPY